MNGHKNKDKPLLSMSDTKFLNYLLKFEWKNIFLNLPWNRMEISSKEGGTWAVLETTVAVARMTRHCRDWKTVSSS